MHNTYVSHTDTHIHTHIEIDFRYRVVAGTFWRINSTRPCTSLSYIYGCVYVPLKFAYFLT